MQLVHTINAPVGYVYQTIIDSVVYDIKQATGNTIAAGALLNYEYQKPLGKRGRGRVKITKADKNRVYAFETRTARTTYWVEYALQETQDNGTKITYTENTAHQQRMQDYNQMLMMLLLGRGRKRRIKMMLDAIEQQYQG